ncbi:MAG: 30S ribosomal protein S17 [Parcubacteria group bacterium GW2011_GWA2_56_21]|nr:MAG: 30S ribosomal protein S17 [Parcubacteria group bacterium GW2011_GWA2_56_21]
MKDTAVVRVDRYVKNAKYKKYFVRSKKYLVHDSGNTAQVGDKVTIVATKPISKRKHFKLVPKS